MDIERLKEVVNMERVTSYDKYGIFFEAEYSEDILDLIEKPSLASRSTSEEVQREINRLTDALKQTKEAAKELKEQKYAVNMLPVYNQIKSLELQITALQAYQPTTRKDRTG